MICSRCHLDMDRDQFGPSAEMWPDRRVCHPCSRQVSQRKRHGLTQAERIQIAEAQGGCAICGHAEPGKKGWVVDHDRACCPGDKSCPKCRRGVVCQWCNSVLGYAFDRVETLTAAIAYLQAHESRSDPCSWHMPVALHQASAPSICSMQCTDGLGRTGLTQMPAQSSDDRSGRNAHEVDDLWLAEWTPSRGLPQPDRLREIARDSASFEDTSAKEALNGIVKGLAE